MITPARVKSIYKTWQLVALVEFGSKEQNLKALKTVTINTTPFFIFRTMFVIKQKILQVFKNVKARDLVMKILFTLAFVLYCFFCTHVLIP